MCEPGADETPHGVRVFEGHWSDAYLGRFPVRPGYAYVIWKGATSLSRRSSQTRRRRDSGARWPTCPAASPSAAGPSR